LAAILFIPLILPAAALSMPVKMKLFGYREVPQHGMEYLPQWLSVLERHLQQDVPDGDCHDHLFNRCHLKKWYQFLDSIKDLPRWQQLEKVNRYANHKHYVLDLANYGMEDYWAIVKEFLSNGGDCEDYAITKFFSLRWLGFKNRDLRIVILQDANLRIPHAILAVFFQGDVVILDNQVQEIVSQKIIAHYIPLYSVNEKEWWLHLPPGL
jgi:predicted transglutaminase-like cysteine proteinase